MSVEVNRAPHNVTRLDVHTGIAFDTFRKAFEDAAPPFAEAGVTDIAARGGSWDDVKAAIAAYAPNDLMIFATIDGIPMMSVAGHRTKAVEYLLGNHVIAETMFRHNPLALLYAPLRILVYSQVSEDGSDQAVFSLDQPSTVFASLEHPEISQVGRDLDAKVRNLLKVTGVDTDHWA
ncbi:hypothetical protein BH09ACT8_BH09ACT8_54780 [soil metagenome]